MILKSEIKRMLEKAADMWLEKKDYLSEIDSRFGDGDHGVTIGKIAKVTKEMSDCWDEDDIGAFLTALGEAIMEIGGGSAGPLYGTMIGGLGESLDGVKEIDAGMLKQMFADCLSAMQTITTAKVGDKTMMDALIPAAEAAQSADNDMEAILKMAKDAAAEGAKESEQYISKFGRARSYKEQTIGTPDAGAVSTALFFEGLYKGYCSE